MATLKTKGWKEYKFGKHKISTMTFNIKIDDRYIPVSGHIVWIHNEEVNRDAIDNQTLHIEHFISKPFGDFLIYRQLMLEAGFVAKYFWLYNEIQHQVWTHK